MTDITILCSFDSSLNDLDFIPSHKFTRKLERVQAICRKVVKMCAMVGHVGEMTAEKSCTYRKHGFLWLVLFLFYSTWFLCCTLPISWQFVVRLVNTQHPIFMPPLVFFTLTRLCSFKLWNQLWHRCVSSCVFHLVFYSGSIHFLFTFLLFHFCSLHREAFMY